MINEPDIRSRLMPVSVFVYKQLRSSEPKIIREKLAELQEIQRMAQGAFPVHENDIYWYRSLCLKELGDYENAVVSLFNLWRGIDIAKANIREPGQRAALHTKYMNMYRILAELLMGMGDAQQLLTAIEGNKGRYLSETINTNVGDVKTEMDFRKAVQALPAIQQRYDCHFQSFLVDKDCTFCVLSTKQGKLHAHRCTISKGELLKGLANINPATWGRKTSIRKKASDDLSERLSPLVDWLWPLYKEGILQRNDHICYCPDGILQLIPLHYILIKGEPLVCYFSCSRINGILSFLRIVENPTIKLKKYVAIQVPAADDIYNQSKIEAIGAASCWLNKNLNGYTLKNTEATFESLKKIDFSQKVVHFSTHGVFDSKFRENPYNKSGLLLSAYNTLPSLDIGSTERTLKHLFTPQKLLENLGTFQNSHVTLQACVSGLATEGQGRDLLGMELALLAKGVSSLLSTHWNVDARHAAKFSLSFYKRWIERGLSRAVAWRLCALERYKQEIIYEKHKAYYWAPYTLSGDWR